MTRKYLFWLLILKISVGMCQLSGVYTVGGSAPNYNTINDAVLALTTSGVNGPVTFDIRSGIYNEKVLIPAINGASAINRITFQSESLDSSSVIIQNNSSVLADNYLFYMNGADYISIKYLSLKRNVSSANGCRIIRLENGANNNTLENCHLTGKTSGTSGDHELIYSTNSKDTGNVIKNNIIENGWYGIFFTGTSGANEFGNKIESNHFLNNVYGINVNYFLNLLIANNKINTINAAISLSYGTSKNCVSFNNIITASGTGISILNCSTPVNDSLKIIGNMVKSGYGDGIFLMSSPRAYVFHNSVLAYGTSQYNPLRSILSTVTVKNNIIKNATSTACIYYSSSSVVSDYNIFYCPGTILIGYDSYSFPTISAWSTMFFQDQHSYQTNPTFNSLSDLHITGDFSASNNGQNLNINTDLDYDSRTVTPDIGADEFDQPDNDAGIYAIPNIVSPMCTGTTAITVSIRNFGELPLTQATINWSVNGMIQPTYNWTGNLTYTNVSTAIPIGTVSILQNQIYNLKVWTTSPNGFADPLNANDTIFKGPILTRLSGYYTIGGASPNYTSVVSAINDLSLRGVCSPVTFNLRPGDYVESIILPVVNGANGSNIITFQSQNQDSSTTRIVKPDIGSTRIIENVPNAGYFRFKQLTIGRTDDPFDTFNDIMNLISAHHLGFQNCVFKGGSRFSGIAMNFHDCNYVTIDQCRIELMNIGINISGNSAFVRDSIYIIKNNILKNIIGSNMTIDNVQDSIIITNNLIENDTITIPTNYSQASGISISRISKNFEITSNQITGNYYRALSIGFLSGNSMYMRNVSNNFISARCPANSNQLSPVMIINVSYLDFIHNSIRAYRMPQYNNSIMGKYRAVLELSAGSPSSNIKMLNNCFESDSTLYLLYDYVTSGPVAFSQFNYNNFYIKDPSYTQMSNWTGLWPNGLNANSTYVNPLYLSRTDLHTANPQLVAGTPTYIIDDIDGDPRATVPTIGADECIPVTITINANSLENSYKITPNPANTFIKISYEGYKNSTIQLISIDGKIVFEKTNYTSGEMVDLTKCEEGLYTVSVKTENENYFSKIVIIK